MPHVDSIGLQRSRPRGLRSRALAMGAMALLALAAGCSDDTDTADTTTSEVVDTSTTEPGTGDTTEADTTDADTTDDGVTIDGTEGAFVLELMAEAGLEVDLDDEALACIDEVFAGVDLTLFDTQYDPFAGDLDDEDINGRSGRMLDECLDEEARVALVGASMTSAELGTAEQVLCAAQGFDALVLDMGTYEELLLNEIDVMDPMLALFGECGMDLGDDASLETASDCETTQRVIEVAIEAYFADNSVDAESYADLVPEYVREDPSDTFELVSGDDGVPVPIGVNECDGYGG